ncbi:THAP domain-containing protein 9, partial [Harpegnathos saltator]
GFLGFLICINSAQLLFQTLFQDRNVLKYIPFYKLNQDHKELLFSCIRPRRGGNNNPTTRLFKAAMKKLLVHCQLRNASTGNCIALENISILHILSFHSNVNSENIIQWSSGLQRLKDDIVVEDDVYDHDYIPDVKYLSEFSRDVTVYIAGYVVMQLQRTILCNYCIDALKSNQRIYSDSLIAYKDKGKLTYPSNDVLKVCHTCEKIIRNALCERGGIYMKKHFTAEYLTIKALTRFIGYKLFVTLENHTSEQNAVDNYIVYLMRAICNKYIKIRLHFIAQ